MGKRETERGEAASGSFALLLLNGGREHAGDVFKMPPTLVNMSCHRTSGAASYSAFTPPDPTAEPPVVDPQRRRILRQVKKGPTTFFVGNSNDCI